MGPPTSTDAPVATAPVPPTADDADGAGRVSRGVAAASLALAAVAIVVANRWGEALIADGLRMKVHTPPLRGPTDWHLGVGAIPAVAVAGLVIWAGPVTARRLSWPGVLGVAGLAAAGWAVALAFVDGPDALTGPLHAEGQYLNTLRHISDLSTFLSTFTERITDYNIHTQGHPPGMVVVDYGLREIGLGGFRWNTAFVMAGGGGGVIATLIAVRDVAGESVARRVAPVLALAPAAIWWSSADAFFFGVTAAAIAALVVATNRAGRSQMLLAAGAGVGFTAAIYLSYGLVLAALVPLGVAFVRRSLRPVVIAAAVGLGLVVLITAGTGFVWWDGLAATRERYFAGVAAIRPYDYFLLANLAVFALMIGPAAVAALGARGRARAFAALIGGGVAAVLVADLSGMSKAEVERIWLPFVPWVLVGAAAVLTSRRATRGWLGAQAVLTLAVASTVRSPW